MWIEQGFIVGDLSKWVNPDKVLTTKFISTMDTKELVIQFNEKDSLVFSLLC